MKLPKVSWPPRFLYGLYERRLARELKPEKLPGHIGVMVDGNRRWAKLAGASTASGHRAGADKILEFLEWCRELGIRTVTLYMLSTENLNRDSSEVGALLRIIDETLTRVGSEGSMRVHPVGALDVLPLELADKLRGLRDSTADRTGLHVNVAVGYGGRREIVDPRGDVFAISSTRRDRRAPASSCAPPPKMRAIRSCATTSTSSLACGARSRSANRR